MPWHCGNKKKQRRCHGSRLTSAEGGATAKTAREAAAMRSRINYSSQFHKKMGQKNTRDTPLTKKIIIISTPFQPRNIGHTSSTAFSTSIPAYGGIGCKTTRQESKTNIMGHWGTPSASPTIAPGRSSSYSAPSRVFPRPPTKSITMQQRSNGLNQGETSGIMSGL